MASQKQIEEEFWKNKKIVVTGASRGIGLDLCKVLKELGAFVIGICSPNSEEKFREQKVVDLVIGADFKDSKQVAKAAEACGLVDGLVNNAGQSKLEPFLETSLEIFEETFNVNVKSVFIFSQIIAKAMVQAGKEGAIVNVSSAGSAIALKDHTSYCTSKGALDQLTRMMALELGPHKIRVNSVNPAMVMTDMGKMAWSDPKKAGPALARIPMGRFIEEREVSNTIVFLLSPKSSMIQGHLLFIDGGYLIN